jgi:GTPase involved in cell partitioning and DNA repair
VHADDPAGDYHVVRQELALYNPEYCARPHVVALNKMDLDDAAELHREAAQDILAVARRMQVLMHASVNDPLVQHRALTKSRP